MSEPKDGLPRAFPPPLSDMKIDVRAARSKGMVMLRFSPEKNWVGFDTKTARRLAEALVSAADACENRVS
jgi:hypothetical protein